MKHRLIVFALGTLIAHNTAGCLPAENYAGRDQPGPHLIIGLDHDELKQIATVWGTEWADALIADPRWPTCRQAAALTAAHAIVRTAIDDIARILDSEILRHTSR